MENKEIEELLFKSALPHMASAERKIFGAQEGVLQCQQCGEYKAKWNRHRTAYVEDDRNFACLCLDCQAENDEYWDEM